MMANVYVPLWVFPAVWIALCFSPDAWKLMQRLTRRKR
jgi:hypothetical protein